MPLNGSCGTKRDYRDEREIYDKFMSEDERETKRRRERKKEARQKTFQQCWDELLIVSHSG